ncbi:MAG: GntR family transcriptional regulator [Chloroflexi bacterium]|nr:GntR family transcriptional regulator [Chloroflexota bacterium]
MTKASSLPKLKRPETLDELAYKHIKEAILNDSFHPGEFVAEVQLAHDLGISKTPVRKAMGRLQQEGFLVNFPFEGYYVAEISVDDITEKYELRQILECYALQKSIPLFTDAELNDLERLLKDADDALARSDPAEFINLNRQFHHAFDCKYQNPRISAVLANLDEHVQRILLHEYRDQQTDLYASHKEHYMILAAVKERDVDAAVHLMERHLKRFANALVARTEKSESTDASLAVTSL